MARYFEPLSPPPPIPDPHAELLLSLSRISTFNPPVQTCSTGWTFHGFYEGPTSIALLFYRLSHLYPDLEFKCQSLLDWAQAYLDLGSHYLSLKRPTVDAFHCGVTNETLCQLALRSLIHEDASLAQHLCSFSSIINSVDDDGSNEWLYGRAGYLYLLRLVLKLTSSPTPSLIQLLNATITSTISRILDSPSPWTWLGKAYLGAAHGAIGIILQILLSCPHSDTPKLTGQLRPMLLSVLNEQLPSGNFRVSPIIVLQSLRIMTDDRLVQFCHGSPGIVLSLMSIRAFYEGDTEVTSRIDVAVERAQPNILRRGLLTKSPSLCHGIPTNALALTEEAKMEGYMAYVSTASLEGSLGESLGWMSDVGHADDFAGLYTGEAGRAWVWALLDTRKRSDKRPGNWRSIVGFNDI